jgi:hypothetical protein
MMQPAEAAIVIKPLAGSPTCSWWICTDEEFLERYRLELPRITGSAMAKTIRPIILGGRLP